MAVLPDDYSKSLRNFILVLSVISVVGVIGLFGNFSDPMSEDGSDEPRIGDGSDGFFDSERSMYGVQESDLPENLTFEEKSYGEVVVFEFSADPHNDESFENGFSDAMADLKTSNALILQDEDVSYWDDRYSKRVDKSRPVVKEDGSVVFGFNYDKEDIGERFDDAYVTAGNIGYRIVNLPDVVDSGLNFSDNVNEYSEVNGVPFELDVDVSRRDYVTASDTSNFDDKDKLKDFVLKGYVETAHYYFARDRENEYVELNVSKNFYAVVEDTVVGVGVMKFEDGGRGRIYENPEFELFIEDLKYRNHDLDFVFDPTDNVTQRVETSKSFNDFLALNQSEGVGDEFTDGRDNRVMGDRFSYGITVRSVDRLD